MRPRPRIQRRRRATIPLVLFAALVGPGARAQDAEPADSTLRETVTVSAFVETEADVRVGTSATVIQPDDVAAPPSSVADLVVAAAGVAENGQGGLFQVISIRGVSRHRVASSLDGARIFGDRRAGVSSSFVDPLLLGSAEVLRGSATVFHGSGAVGGIVSMRTRSFDAPFVDTGWSSDGDENWQVAGTGGATWSAAIARRQRRDGETPAGEPLYSRYERWSAALRWSRAIGRLDSTLTFVPSITDEIGKPNSDYPDRVTTYPSETHQLATWSLEADERWRMSVFVHPHDLETEVVRTTSRELVFNDSVDVGARWSATRRGADASSPTLRYGVELLARTGVDAIEERRETDPFSAEPDEVLRTLDGAAGGELGAFAALRWRWAGADWETGARFERAERDDGGVRERSFDAWDGFVAFERPLARGLRLRAALDSGVRFPNLSELFFSGTTARGGILGNPALEAERALGGELGLRWLAGRALFGLGLFRNEIDEFIELQRDASDPDIRRYVNLTSGTIRGVEFDGTFVPAEHWRVAWAAHLLEGRAGDGSPLADIPPDELRLSVSHEPGAWSWDARVVHRGSKGDAGDGELPLEASTVVDASIGRRIAPGWRLALSARNLFDETWVPSADDKAVPAPGRAVALRFTRAAD